MRVPWIIVAAITLMAVGMARAAPPPELEVPLTIDYATMDEALSHQLYTDNGRARLWTGADACQYLYAEHPALSRDGDRLKLDERRHAESRRGSELQLREPDLDGREESRPSCSPTSRAICSRVRVTDLNLLDHLHEKTLIAGRGFDLVKQNFIPKIPDLRVRSESRHDATAGPCGSREPPEVAQRVEAALASLRVLPEIDEVPDDGLRARFQMTLPAFPAASPAPVAAQLTPAELAAFEAQLNQWDAFLVFAIKQLGGVNEDPQFRLDLFDLLIDSRYQLVKALAHPESSGPDPVRICFSTIGTGSWRQNSGRCAPRYARRPFVGSSSRSSGG